MNENDNWLKSMRVKQREALNARGDDFDSSHLIRANGMFSYLGVTPEQVIEVKIKHGIYMEGAGRINVAGITEENVNLLADAIIDVV